MPEPWEITKKQAAELYELNRERTERAFREDSWLFAQQTGGDSSADTDANDGDESDD